MRPSACSRGGIVMKTMPMIKAGTAKTMDTIVCRRYSLKRERINTRIKMNDERSEIRGREGRRTRSLARA